ncbi:MAG TPA: metal ABC transporter substrate-binding protein [Acidimicrobiales bacterium]|nr:metal ABC transporter substrate-binding protein [Acidimicrobiales bacterium]
MRALALGLLPLLLLPACRDGAGNDGRLSVVAALFPVAEVARAVGGGDVQVHDLTPVDAEPHDFEPGPGDVDRIEDADVVLYLGGGFQPAVERAADRSDARPVDLLEGDDPHVWLDPVLMRRLAADVADAFADVDPDNADAYRRRAGTFAADLAALDAEYADALRACDRRVIVTTHGAFVRLADRYDLRQEALTGTAPEAEPDPRRVAELLDLIRREGVTTVFTEGTDDTPAAESLAREAGVRTAVLRTLEQPVDGGYTKGMRDNLAVLTEALGCRR